MTWTSNKPTVPGWYWLIESHRKHLAADIVLMAEREGEHWIYFINGRHEYVRFIQGDWSGPLEPPHAPLARPGEETNV